jgi:hypothetical protein
VNLLLSLFDLIVSNVDPGHRDVLNHGDVSKLQERLNEIEEVRMCDIYDKLCVTFALFCLGETTLALRKLLPN